MKRYFLSLATAATLLTACNTGKNAVTGRGQSFLVSETQMQEMAKMEYKQFLDSVRPVTGTANAEMVRRVGSRISSAITKYYASQGKSSALDGFSWEYNLVDSKEANAWCMPGGKIVVYTGILPLTQNENALAVVLGHEIAHAVAEHGRERMSSELKRQGLGTLASVLLSGSGVSQQTSNVFLSAYDVGSQIGYALPHSRSQESEADKLGLMYCALGGYNPQEAVSFWQRMSAASGGQAPPQLLSTHPSDATRIKAIQQELPEAMKYYKPAGK
jgi:predicted Zn-dependent protease